MPDSYLRPAGSEITSPLAEHLASLVISIRGHVVALIDADEQGERFDAFTRALRDLERLNQLIEPDLTSSSHIDS